MDLKKIQEAISKVKEVQHGDIENAILAQTIGNKGLVKVGTLFGVDVYSSDGLPEGVDLIVCSKLDIERNGGEL